MNFRKIQDHLQAAQYHMQAAHALMAEDAQALGTASMQHIASKIVEVLPYSLQDLRSSSRRQELVKCRCILAYHLNRLGFGPTEIGRFLDRDHSTILYTINIYAANYDQNSLFRAMAERARAAAAAGLAAGTATDKMQAL